MNPHSHPDKERLPHAPGAPKYYRRALVFFNMILAGVVREWDQSPTPYPATSKLSELYGQNAHLLAHVEETFGEKTRTALHGLLTDFANMFVHVDEKLGPPGGKKPGHA